MSFFTLFSYFGLPLILFFVCLPFLLNSRGTGRTALTALSLGASVNGIAKQLLKIPHRWVTEPGFEPKLMEAGYAMPCERSMLAAAVLTAIALSTKKTWARIVCAAGIILTAASRLYLGVQSFADVLVGVLLGAGCAVLVHFVKDPARLGLCAGCGLVCALLGGSAWGLGLSVTAGLHLLCEGLFRKTDRPRHILLILLELLLCAGACLALYIGVPFLVEWLLTPRWPGEALIVLLITALPVTLLPLAFRWLTDWRTEAK